MPSAEQVDAIGLGAQPRRGAARPRRERELPFELVLEQTLDDLDALLDLEGERPLRQPRGGGRAEQVRPLERAVRLGQRRQTCLGDALEQLDRVVDVRPP